MKIFQELRVEGAAKPEQYAALGPAIARLLAPSWHRDEQRERENDALLDDAKPFFIFNRVEELGLPAASLVLVCHGLMMEVANVVPTKPGQLSIAEYNAVLRDFYDRGARPAAAQLGLTADLSPDEVPMTKWMSEATFLALKRFNSIANKSTGSAHPRDRDRWLDFIISAHRESAHLGGDMLKRWLVEEAGWDNERASDLVVEYEFGRELLSRAD